MKRVLLDCDGPLSDFDESAVRVLREHVPVGWEPPLGVWAMQDSLSPELKQWFESQCRAPGFALNMVVVNGAKEAVKRLQKTTDVYVVTSPFRKSLHWPGERLLWLQQNLGFRADQVVLTPAKYVVKGDVLVDDHFENLMKWKAEWPDGLAVLWKTRGNHPSWDDPRVLAIDGWEDPQFWTEIER